MSPPERPEGDTGAREPEAAAAGPNPAPPTLPSVLVVEDEASVRRVLEATLRAEGYQPLSAATAQEGRALAVGRRVDFFLVDLGLPDGDGLPLIGWLREWTERPILVLSGRLEERHKVAALDAGADDYITKPFSVAELHARLRVAQRRAARGPSGRPLLRFGAVSVDLPARVVERAGTRLHLTALQWRLLETLARHAGRALTAQHLLQEVWGPGRADQVHYLRIYVRQLRQHLEPDPARPVYLVTETGLGYRLVPDPD